MTRKPEKLFFLVTIFNLFLNYHRGKISPKINSCKSLNLWVLVLNFCSLKKMYRISTSVSNVLLIWALNHQIEKVLDYVFCKSEYIIKYINSFGTDWTILYFLNFLENCQPIMWKTFRKSAKTKVMQSMQKPRHNWHLKSLNDFKLDLNPRL